MPGVQHTNTRIVTNESVASPELHRVGAGRAALFSSARPGTIGSNEDAAALVEWSPEAAVLVVADGAGGLPSGAEAARLTVETLSTQIRSTVKRGGSPREGVLDGIEAANRKVCGLGVGAGATVAVAEISSGAMRSYHAGDAAVLLTGQRGRLKHLTQAHSPVGYAVEAGLLSEADALRHDELHVVSNLVGSTDMRIELGPPVGLGKLDTVVVASDGVLDNLSITEIVDLVRKGPLLQAARSLAAACQQRMQAPESGLPSKEDDLTFILYRLGG